MTKGLVWIPNDGSSFIEIISSLSRKWVVACNSDLNFECSEFIASHESIPIAIDYLSTEVEPAQMIFQTPSSNGGERVSFWLVGQRLLRVVLLANVIGGVELTSCMFSEDCDHLMLESLALEVLARRQFVNAGVLFDDAWSQIAARCKLGVWFGRPDWDFSRNVLLTSANPSTLENILSLATRSGAKELDNFNEALRRWRTDFRGNCVCMVDIETELSKYV